MTEYEHYTDTRVGHARLYKLLKDNNIITTNDNTPTLKGVVAAAAINHLSSLSPQKQFEIIAGYLKKIGS